MVAVSRSEDYLAAHEGANPLAVLTKGFQSAFCVVLAGIGMELALLLLGRPRKAPRERLEPLPGPAPRPEEREGRSVDRSEEIVDHPDGWVAEHIRDYVATDGRRRPPVHRPEHPPARDPGGRPPP